MCQDAKYAGIVSPRLDLDRPAIARIVRAIGLHGHVANTETRCGCNAKNTLTEAALLRRGMRLHNSNGIRARLYVAKHLAMMGRGGCYEAGGEG